MGSSVNNISTKQESLQLSHAESRDSCQNAENKQQWAYSVLRWITT